MKAMSRMKWRYTRTPARCGWIIRFKEWWPVSVAVMIGFASQAIADTEIEHVCGSGPQEVVVSYATGCPGACSSSVTPNGDGTYSEGPSTCTLAICYETTVQDWSDWPECPGAKRLSISDRELYPE